MIRILLAMVVLVLPSLSWSASADSTISGRANSLRDGAWALQFAITDFVSLDEFEGGISLKRHFSDKSAVRFGVDVGAQSSSAENAGTPADSDELDLYSARLSALYQRYLNPTDDAIAYWGVGPFARASTTSREHSFDTSSSVRYSEALDLESYDIGASAILGVEWFASRTISLHAEYSANVSYFSDELTRTYQRTGQPDVIERQETHGWSASTGGVRFGLSVYF